MGTIMGTLISVVLLIVAVWVAIFGGVGALLARSRGGSGPMGLAWGTALGPVGWLVIAWVTRADGPEGLAPADSSSPPVAEIGRAPSERNVDSAERRWDAWNE